VQDEKQKAYGLLNLRLTYQPENSPLTFGAFVTNVLEQDYIKDAGNTGDAFGIPTFIAGEPRFVGGSVSIKR
jgi:outer membrane receptor protein involved in Fe transport